MLESNGGRPPMVRRVSIALVVLAIVSAFSCKVIVPGVIHAAYDGRSVGVFNHYMEGKRAYQPVSYYIAPWSAAGTLSGLLFLAGAVGVWFIASRRFYDRFVGPASANSLGIVRVIVSATILINLLWEDLASSALLPAAMRQPMGFLQVFYLLPIHFNRFVSSAAELRLFQWVAIALVTLVLLGWRTRLLLPLATLAAFIVGGILRQYEHLYHTGLVAFYVLVVLCFTPCGDGFSLDARRAARPDGGHQPKAIYGWARYACWVTVSCCYFSASLSKLRWGGLWWWTPTNMRNIVFADSLTTMQFHWGIALHLVHAPAALFGVMGVSALLLEFLYPLVLFSAAARRIVPLVAAAMHVGIFLMQNILFFDLILLQLLFVDFEKWMEPRPRLSFTTFDEPGAGSPLRPIVVGLLALFLLIPWTCRVDFYPFTYWGMYATYSDVPQVMYLRLITRHRSGMVARAHPERVIGALADARYRRALNNGFQSAQGRAVAMRMLQVYATEYNYEFPADPITVVIAQSWTWNWKNDQPPPFGGKLVDQYQLNVGSD